MWSDLVQLTLTWSRYESELVTHKKHIEEYEKELYSNFQKAWSFFRKW